MKPTETTFEIICVHRWGWEFYWGGPINQPAQEFNSHCKRCDTVIKSVKKEEYDPEPRVVVYRGSFTHEAK